MAQASKQSRPANEPTAAEIIERLSRFEGPPEQFLTNLLAVQCYLSGASAGAILRATSEQVEVLSLFPPPEEGQDAPRWLAHVAEQAPAVLEEGSTVISPLHATDELYGQPADQHAIMLPLRGSAGIRGIAAFTAETDNARALSACRERLEITTSLLSLYEMRLTLQRRQADMRRLRVAMETISAVNEHDRLAGSTMAMCNEIASRFDCDRVSLGFLQGRYVKLRALSHTEKFARKMTVVQKVEAAMEECIDQDVEVVHPSGPDATYVSRATAELARHETPSAIVSVPLRRAGEAFAVLTAERSADNPFTIEEVESLRLTADLLAARMKKLWDTDRWFGARAVTGLRNSLAWFVGPKHTWAKVAAVAVLAVVLALVLVPGDYRVDSPFALEAETLQVVPAPFEGYLQEVNVRPGDIVIGGETVLARLKTERIEMSLREQRAALRRYEKQADQAAAQAAAGDLPKRAEAQMARAMADQTRAQIALLEHQKAEASLVAPIDGRVISGDWKRQIGSPVEKGKAMFEISPLEALEAELSVSEEDIADVLAAKEEAEQAGEELHGELASASFPQRKIEFVVEHVNPVAQVVDKRNVFHIRVRLLDRESWMRPGMEGVAKVDIGQRSYGWLLTRRLVNWLRMKLWW